MTEGSVDHLGGRKGGFGCDGGLESFCCSWLLRVNFITEVAPEKTRNGVGQTQVRGVRRTPLEVDQLAAEVVPQSCRRFTGGVGSRTVLLHPYSFHAHPFPLFDLPERLQNGNTERSSNALCSQFVLVQAHLRRKTARLHGVFTSSPPSGWHSGSVSLNFSPADEPPTC